MSEGGSASGHISSRRVSATRQCLDLAERILTTILDRDSVKKYFAVREQLYAGQVEGFPTRSLDAYTHERAYRLYEMLASGNERLRSEIERLTKEVPDYDEAENQRMVDGIRELEREILPTKVLPAKGTAVEEVENLRRVVEAKMDSLEYVRSSLAEKNRILKEKLEGLERRVEEEVQNARAKVDEETREARGREAAAKKRCEEKTAELQGLREEIAREEERRDGLGERLAQAKQAADEAEAEAQRLGAEIAQMRERGKRLSRKAILLRRQCEEKKAELEALRSQEIARLVPQRGMSVQEHTRRMKEKAEELRAESTCLRYDLEALRGDGGKEAAQPPGVVVSTAVRLDQPGVEDIVAAEIFERRLASRRRGQ